MLSSDIIGAFRCTPDSNLDPRTVVDQNAVVPTCSVSPGSVLK